MATAMSMMGKAVIGPASWSNVTVKDVNMSDSLCRRSNKSCALGKKLDPLPHVREIIREISNNESQRYFRQTRNVVSILRESMADTNEEIKSLTRGKEALERIIEHTRKDIQLNKDNVEYRTNRPPKELPKDGADDLLFAEKQTLLNIKKSMESQLKVVQQHLQVLSVARRDLKAVCQERSHVLDLICHETISCPKTAMTHRGTLITTPHRMTVSADGEREERYNIIDPLGPYTPEVDRCLLAGKDAQIRSAVLRRETAEIIDKTERIQRAVHQSVNDGVVQKIAETVTLKERLVHAAAVNRDSTHKSQRWYDATELAWHYTQGPVSSSDITTREKLTRPVVRMYHRHPGNELPEASELGKGSDTLLDSLRNTSKNIAMLKLTKLHLKDNIRGKNLAINVDGDVVRERRRKANHRWAMKGAFDGPFGGVFGNPF
ncbi:coiled-coil domain containing 105 [Lamellibrachia satsuma]|nr:coiled-coil domain containing 105 [Lamellibrachia satsuma]